MHNEYDNVKYLQDPYSYISIKIVRPNLRMKLFIDQFLRIVNIQMYHHQ